MSATPDEPYPGAPFSIGIVSNASTWYLLRVTAAAPAAEAEAEDESRLTLDTDVDIDTEANAAPRVQLTQLAHLPLHDPADLPRFLPNPSAASGSDTACSSDGHAHAITHPAP